MLRDGRKKVWTAKDDNYFHSVLLAIVTNYHKLSVLKSEDLLFYGSGGQKSVKYPRLKIKGCIHSRKRRICSLAFFSF